MNEVNQKIDSKEEYRKLCRETQKECRKAKEDQYKNICIELEGLDRKNNSKLFSVIKNELQQKKAQVRAGLKDDKGEILLETTKIIARWHIEYVTALYADDRTQVIIKNEKKQNNGKNPRRGSKESN